MNRWKDGIVAIKEGLIISPGYSFNDFKKTSFYNGQAGIRIIKIEGLIYIDNHKYLVDLFFLKGIIYRVSFVCCDREFTMECEEQRRELHNEILQQYGLNRENEYAWGKIISNYDAKGNISSISFYYSRN